MANLFEPDVELRWRGKEGYWQLDHPTFAQAKRFLSTL